jgi:hypothetical protein
MTSLQAATSMPRRSGRPGPRLSRRHTWSVSGVGSQPVRRTAASAGATPMEQHPCARSAGSVGERCRGAPGLVRRTGVDDDGQVEARVGDTGRGAQHDGCDAVCLRCRVQHRAGPGAGCREDDPVRRTDEALDGRAHVILVCWSFLADHWSCEDGARGSGSVCAERDDGRGRRGVWVPETAAHVMRRADIRGAGRRRGHVVACGFAVEGSGGHDPVGRVTGAPGATT